MKQYSKMTKASLVRKIMKALKKLPKTKLIKLCYELEKRKLPTINTSTSVISTTKRNMPRLTARRAFVKRPKGEIISQRRYDGFDVGRKKPRSAKQRANDKRLGLMAKRRAKARRRSR